MIRINLIPRELLVKEQQKQYVIQVVVAAALAAIVLVVLSAGHWYKAARMEAKLREDKKKLDHLQEIVNKVQALEQQASAVRTRLGVVTDLLKSRPLYLYFMTDIAKTLPGGVWLTQLTTHSQANNQLSVTAAATSTTSEGIAQWLRNLQGSGKFSDPTLSAISISGVEGSKTHTFSVSSSYKSPEL